MGLYHPNVSFLDNSNLQNFSLLYWLLRLESNVILLRKHQALQGGDNFAGGGGDGQTFIIKRNLCCQM